MKPEPGAWYASLRSDVVVGRSVRRSGSVSPSYAGDTGESGLVRGAAYGTPFNPAPAGLTSGRAVDPVILTSLARTGNSTNGWTLDAVWTGGTPPYTAVAGTDPGFETDVTTVAMETATTSAQISVDPGDGGMYFNVVDPTTVSPAVQGMGYDPQPPPQTASTSSTSTWWGQEITITGRYFSPIAAENLAFMYDLPVKATSTAVPSGSRFADSVTFTIPEDARGFPAIVSTQGKWRCCFADAPWVAMAPPGAGPYADITGLAWSPESGNAWISANGIVEEIDLFLTVPRIVSTTGAYGRPYISRVADSGTILVIDRDAPGTIWELSPGSGDAAIFASTTDDGFQRAVDPVGLAVDPDGNAAYIADSVGGKVVRIPRGAGSGSEITDGWGGVSFIFADPCGIDVAPTHQVFVAHENGWTYQLTGPTTSSYEDHVGPGIHSLEFDRDVSSSAMLYYFTTTDLATAEAFNLRSLATAGGQPRYRGGRLWGMADGRVLLEFDMVFASYHHFPQRVILSNQAATQPYPSPYQVADRVIRLDGRGWDQSRLHLRLIDPPDTAPYAPEGGWPDSGADQAGDPAPAVPPYEGNDNVGYADPDHGLSLNPDGPWTQTLEVYPVKPQGEPHAVYTCYLKVPARYSGDNFQVEIVKCDGAGNPLPERVAAMSTVYTSWKRIFVERDSMFRKGGVLAEDYDPETCGGTGLPCNQIRVYEWTNVEPGDFIVVFDEWVGSQGLWFVPGGTLHPVREVVTVGPADSFGRRILTLDSPIDRPFEVSPFWEASPGGARQPTFCDENGANCHSAGFGVVSNCDLDWNQINSTDSCFFNVDLRGVERPFGDAFVEIVAPRRGRDFLPFLPWSWFYWEKNTYRPDHVQLDAYPTDHFAWIWFGNKADPLGNYVQVQAVSSNGDGILGETVSSFRRTLIFEDLLELSPGLPWTTQGTTIHELGHQFHAQRCSDGGHHNDSVNPKPAWCETAGHCPADASTPELCEMNNGEILDGNGQDMDPVFEFCEECLLLGDDDPGCAGVPRGGAIRTVEDPLPE